MPKFTFEHFLAEVAEGTCLMALDVSAKRIGIAITEPARTIAVPSRTILRSGWETDATALLDFIRGHRVGGIVIGLPLNLDGSIGPAAQSRMTFARNLDSYLADQGAGLPYTLVDESLTSFAARDILGDRKDTKNMEDQIAASLLLQHFLKI